MYKKEKKSANVVDILVQINDLQYSLLVNVLYRYFQIFLLCKKGIRLPVVAMWHLLSDINIYFLLSISKLFILTFAHNV